MQLRGALARGALLTGEDRPRLSVSVDRDQVEACARIAAEHHLIRPKGYDRLEAVRGVDRHCKTVSQAELGRFVHDLDGAPVLRIVGLRDDQGMTSALCTARPRRRVEDVTWRITEGQAWQSLRMVLCPKGRRPAL
jgi:hypothetical protein